VARRNDERRDLGGGQHTAAARRARALPIIQEDAECTRKLGKWRALPAFVRSNRTNFGETWAPDRAVARRDRTRAARPARLRDSVASARDGR
jgi:hypothetical protein